MADIRPIKAELRRVLRQRRNTLDSTRQHAAARALTESVVNLPVWKGARRIALYLAADGEIDTGPLEKIARNLGKYVFLPVVNDDTSLHFARWGADDVMSSNRYGIPEPPASAERCPVADLDIVFMPLVAWDRQGGRLGMGGGFYDRTLSGVHGPVLVGLAHDSQQVDEVPRDPWDIVLDYIATDAALYRRPDGQKTR